MTLSNEPIVNSVVTEVAGDTAVGEIFTGCIKVGIDVLSCNVKIALELLSNKCNLLTATLVPTPIFAELWMIKEVLSIFDVDVLI